MIKFNKNAWLRPYIDMNTNLRKKGKYDFEKLFFNLMNNAFFGKIMVSEIIDRALKLVKRERRKNDLVSEANYHITKFFTENSLAVERKKTEIFINKSV